MVGPVESQADSGHVTHSAGDCTTRADNTDEQCVVVSAQPRDEHASNLTARTVAEAMQDGVRERAAAVVTAAAAAAGRVVQGVSHDWLRTGAASNGRVAHRPQRPLLR